MTLEEKCKLWIEAGKAYNRGDDPIISDYTFDHLSQILLERYTKLPKWFTKQVSPSDLRCGSSAGLKNDDTPNL